MLLTFSILEGKDVEGSAYIIVILIANMVYYTNNPNVTAV